MPLTREKFYVITPKAATNFITNPSFELAATTGYAIYGASTTLAAVATQQRRGAYSCEITPTTAANSGITWTTAGLTNGVTYTFSVDIKDVAGQTFKIFFTDNGGVTVGTPVTWTGTGNWTRKAVTYTAAASANHKLYVSREAIASTTKFYVDGWQLEEGAESTYFDGDSAGQTLQKDYGWNGTPHASTSYRRATTRSGGTLLDIDTYAKVLSHVGLGRAPETNYTSEINADGELWQAVKVNPRDFVLTMVFSGATTGDIVQARKTLLAALAVDKTPVRQPIVLRYQGVDDSGNWMTEPVDIICTYQGGLERAATKFGGEVCAVQFRAVNPYHSIDGGMGALLGYSTTVSNFANIGYRDTDGIWTAMGTGCNGQINAIAIGPDGSIYVGGTFTLAGGVANTSRIAKWNGTAFSPLGTGMNGEVSALAIGPDGDLYAGGIFTLAGGVAANNIAKWNGSVWSALGAGTNGMVKALKFGPDGALIIGGEFTLASGVANTAYIAKWYGSSWQAIGTGMNNFVYALVFGPDDALYAGGSFTLAGGVANTARIARWNGTAWSALGTGMNATVYALVFGSNGALYTGGSFTLAGGVANTAYIAKWNGTAFLSMGLGLNSTVFALSFGVDNLLYAGGFFTKSGGVTFPDRIATWNGSTWNAIDINVGDAAAYVYAILPLADGRLYFGGTWTGSSATSATAAVQNNTGTKAYPIIKATGPGTLWQAKNYTNGDALFFKGLTLLAGETVTIITNPRRFSITSDWSGRGNMNGYISPGSTRFSLEPGSNSVSAYLTAGTGATKVVSSWNATVTSIEEALR